MGEVETRRSSAIIVPKRIGQNFTVPAESANEDGTTTSVPAPRAPESVTTDARSWWGAGFTLTRRGYDPREVEAAFDRASAEYSVVVTDRDELARNELRAREQITELAQELRELAAAPIDGRNLSARLRHMLGLAQEEAAEKSARTPIRRRLPWSSRRARRPGPSTTRRPDGPALWVSRLTAPPGRGWPRRRSRRPRSSSRRSGRRGSCDVRPRTPAPRPRAAWSPPRRGHVDLVSTAEAEAERLTRDGHTERASLDEASQARRAQAEHDFEIALTARREESAAALKASDRDRQEVEKAARAAQDAAAAQLTATTAATEALQEHQREITARFSALRELLDHAATPVSRPAGTPAG